MENTEYKNLIQEADTIEKLHKVKAQLNAFLGQKMQELAAKNIEEKKIEGRKLNELKNEITKLIKEKEDQFSQIHTKRIDYTLPLPFPKSGKKHIFTESVELLNKIFKNMGFQEVVGPDIEKIHYNFDVLNMPADHPARDNNDTFYMNDEELLRTQVTAIQVKVLESMKMPTLRAYSIGQVYRNDKNDATHSCMFNQIEGIILEPGVTMQHLKGFIEYMLENFFEKKVKISFKPSFFPFTEPSCEVFAYAKSHNDKLEFCEDGEPLEIGGCGIIHPSILERCNKKNEQAFAFGMGLERLIMLKYGIKNLQILYKNHIQEMEYYKQRK
jgi:phenylalanyl-tRNA synthetase alpha chain